jgi:two-component system CheB/CheR fusion protein
MFATDAPVIIEEEPITDASGRLHVLATTKVPLHDERGEATHLVGIIHDISRLKRVEEELRRANQELGQAVTEAERLKDQFLQLASHELRSPLASLKLLLSLFKAHLQDQGQADVLQQLLQREQGLLDRLNRLIEDILDVSRIQFGRLSLVRREVALPVLLREAVARARATCGARHAITLDTPDELWVYADAGRLGQVLGSLLANACKYAPDGSLVAVAARPAGTVAEVLVRDAGPGIPLELHGRIFERFYQVEATAGRAFGGLGLGLYISRELITAQGGQISVESTPGAGSTFRFTVPLAGVQADHG